MHKPMTNPMEHDVSCGSVDIFLNISGLSLQFGLAKMLKVIYNDNKIKMFQSFKLAIERTVTQFYMISQGNMCRVIKISFSHLWAEIY